MTQRNGQGPRGKGPRTGRGLGRCRADAPKQAEPVPADGRAGTRGDDPQTLRGQGRGQRLRIRNRACDGSGREQGRGRGQGGRGRGGEERGRGRGR